MYTIKEAAARSGINVPLLRAWERRYGVVSPTRTEAGYRLYGETDIARLRAMRALVDAGWSPSQASGRIAEASVDDLEALSESRPAEPVADPRQSFVDAAAALDGAALERALDEMFATRSFERSVEEHLYPSLAAVGEAWASGQVDVAGEHAASAAALRRLGMAFEAAASAATTGGAPILVGLPPGSRHELGALAFATALRRAGLPVIYLGPDVPVESWASAAETSGARAAVIGAVIDRDVAAADDVVMVLGAEHPDLVVAVGGRAAEAVGNGNVVRLPDGLRDAVETLRAALT
jgi:DNA-binding transcriptional MerR regulator/methylmalonyl-CoA mutase cobalamin-binding subunit